MRDDQQPAIAQYYDRFWAKAERGRELALEPNLLRLLRRHVGEEDACLDLGCGDGRTYGAWLSSHAGSYVGVDISAESVRRACRLGLQAIEVPDASALPFDDSTFDVVVCVEVIEHLFDPSRALCEAARVLRDEGVLILTAPNVAYWRRRLDLAVLGRWNPGGDECAVAAPWRDPHIRFFTVRSLERLLSMSGFPAHEVSGHSGPWLHVVPGLRHLSRAREAGPVYRRVTRRAPGLFAPRLEAVGHLRDQLSRATG